MSAAERRSPASSTHAAAGLFAALGDPTRLALVRKLGDGGRLSVTQLCAGETVTRQAISKHLDVLARARLVQHRRQGRQRLYSLRPGALGEAATYLEQVSALWDEALDRLRHQVETPGNND